MDIQEITVLKSIKPITVLDKPSKLTVETIAKFINMPVFPQFVAISRKQYGVPENGMSIKEFVGHNFDDLPYINNVFVQPALHMIVTPLVKELGMSDEFLSQIMLLVFFNAFIDVEYFDAFISQPIKFILKKKHIASAMYDYPYEVGAILIPYNISQNRLIKWIKQNWKNIYKQMDDNLSNDPYTLRMNKNTELALEITDLKENKKLSFTRIADLLSKKYPEDERVLTESWIKKVYYDYKETLNKLDILIKQK